MSEPMPSNATSWQETGRRPRSVSSGWISSTVVVRAGAMMSPSSLAGARAIAFMRGLSPLAVGFDALGISSRALRVVSSHAARREKSTIAIIRTLVSIAASVDVGLGIAESGCWSLQTLYICVVIFSNTQCLQGSHKKNKHHSSW